MATGVQVQGGVGSDRYPQGHACAPNSLLYVVRTVIAYNNTPKGYPVQAITIGDHIRKARLDAGLCQKNIAELMGVSICTITNWELNRVEPEVRFLPAIIKFLGYVPFECPTDTLGRLAYYKKVNGMSFERLGVAMGKDPNNLWIGCRVGISLFGNHLKKLKSF
jgi:DNA-binding XRE family transcriptional regulator